MSEKNLIGREIVEQVYERMKPGELNKLRQGKKERVLVIKGCYDNIENVLKNAKIPHTLLERFPDVEDFSQRGIYRRSKVIFANCDSEYHDGYNNKYEEKNFGENRKVLRNFVAEGGRIITTDWAQRVFKSLFGKITANEHVTEQEGVKVKYCSDFAKEMSGVFYGNARPTWWLCGSDVIHFRKDSGIIGLIESQELKKLYGSKHIAVGLPYGNGEAFHFVSHFIDQKLEKYDSRDRECLASFLDATKTVLGKKSGKKLTFGEIQTTYTLMYTALELCRDENILPRQNGK